MYYNIYIMEKYNSKVWVFWGLVFGEGGGNKEEEE